MKLLSIALLAFSLSAPLAFAHGDHCCCDKKCETSCKDHHGKKCSTKHHCDCCDMDHGSKAAPAPTKS